jgi:hypothetical protein
MCVFCNHQKEIKSPYTNNKILIQDSELTGWSLFLADVSKENTDDYAEIHLMNVNFCPFCGQKLRDASAYIDVQYTEQNNKAVELGGNNANALYDGCHGFDTDLCRGCEHIKTCCEQIKQVVHEGIDRVMQGG